MRWNISLERLRLIYPLRRNSDLSARIPPCLAQRGRADSQLNSDCLPARISYPEATLTSALRAAGMSVATYEILDDEVNQDILSTAGFLYALELLFKANYVLRLRCVPGKRGQTAVRTLLSIFGFCCRFNIGSCFFKSNLSSVCVAYLVRVRTQSNLRLATDLCCILPQSAQVGC